MLRLLDNTLLYYSLLIMAFVGISIYAATNASSADEKRSSEEREQAISAVERQISLWENNIFGRAESWISEASLSENILEKERGLRISTKWFDSIYIESSSNSYPTEQIVSPLDCCTEQTWTECTNESPVEQVMCSINLSKALLTKRLKFEPA